MWMCHLLYVFMFIVLLLQEYFFKWIAILKCQKSYISQKSDTNFDIRYILCSTEHCVYFNYDKCFKYKIKRYVKFWQRKLHHCNKYVFFFRNLDFHFVLFFPKDETIHWTKKVSRTVCWADKRLSKELSIKKNQKSAQTESTNKRNEKQIDTIYTAGTVFFVNFFYQPCFLYFHWCDGEDLALRDSVTWLNS